MSNVIPFDKYTIKPLPTFDIEEIVVSGLLGDRDVPCSILFNNFGWRDVYFNTRITTMKSGILDIDFSSSYTEEEVDENKNVENIDMTATMTVIQYPFDGSPITKHEYTCNLIPLVALLSNYVPSFLEDYLAFTPANAGVRAWIIFNEVVENHTSYSSTHNVDDDDIIYNELHEVYLAAIAEGIPLHQLYNKIKKGEQK